MSRNVVQFLYTLRDPEGRVLDMSGDDKPVSYLEGAGQIIEGLEEQLKGEAPGNKRVILVPAAKAYGLRDGSLVQKVARDMIPFEGELKVGDQFQTEPDPYAPIVTVLGVDDEGVTLDANHPLAGVDLTFDVQVVSVREATEKEISHGHAHEGGDCGREGGCGCQH